LEKIRSADAFVCDITTINQSAPHPNVIFELGYAIAQLGWERIMMLFNTAYGKFPDDVPFDIDRHRASPFIFELLSQVRPTKKQIAALKEPLIELLYDALRLIIKSQPVKPAFGEEISPDQKKRMQDLVMLKRLLSSIHIPTLDLHIEEALNQVYHRVFYFWESFNEIVSSSSFHFYDQKLMELVKKMHSAWGESLSYGARYDTPQVAMCRFFTLLWTS
jgi:hypothetical protein